MNLFKYLYNGHFNALCGRCILSQPTGKEKIAQNGQTEHTKPFRLCMVTRRRTWVRREAKFVRSIKHFNIKICYKQIFTLNLISL